LSGLQFRNLLHCRVHWKSSSAVGIKVFKTQTSIFEDIFQNRINSSNSTSPIILLEQHQLTLAFQLDYVIKQHKQLKHLEEFLKEYFYDNNAVTHFSS